MRILVLSQYFWPESFIINDIVRVLVDQGHDVVVATGKPNYPDGNVFDGYRARGILREKFLDEIEVLRVPIWPRGSGGARNLVFNYLSFVFSGLFFLPWMLRGKKFDAILVFAPSPITQAIPGILLKWLKKARLTVWIQDLWPESLQATGFVRNSTLLRCVGLLVKAIYSCCDVLLVQSKAFFEPVSAYASLSKIQYFPNLVDVQGKASEGVPPESLLDLLNRYFCVVFAGNLGVAQSLETLVSLAVQLKITEPEVRLVLVGSGSRFAWLQAKKQELALDNLILPGRFAPDVMPAIFERASVLLASLNNEPVFAQTIPSKVQAYLAAARPILVSMNGEGARVVDESGAGLSSPAEEVLPLLANLRALKSMQESERLAMGQAGLAYFYKNFEMRSQVEYLVALLGNYETDGSKSAK